MYFHILISLKNITRLQIQSTGRFISFLQWRQLNIYIFYNHNIFHPFLISLKIKDFLWTGVFCLIDQFETNTAFAFKFSEPCLNTWYWKVFNLSITSSIIIQLKLKLLKYWLLLVNKPILRAQSFDFKTHKFFGLYELFIDSSTY